MITATAIAASTTVDRRPGDRMRELAFERVVVGVRAEIFQLASHLGVFCFLTAAPHGLTPSRFLPGCTAPQLANTARD